MNMAFMSVFSNVHPHLTVSTLSPYKFIIGIPSFTIKYFKHHGYKEFYLRNVYKG